MRILRAIKKLIFPDDRLERLKERGLVTGKNLVLQAGWGIDQSHPWHIVIGDDVTFAPRVQVLAHDASTKMHLGMTRIGKVRIGNRVFVGSSTTILPGVTIGDDVIIGSGSVVSRDIPARTVAAGVPAKVICSLEAFLEKRRAETESVPCFGPEYTLRGGVTPAMKDEMNEAMTSGIGYID